MMMTRHGKVVLLLALHLLLYISIFRGSLSKKSPKFEAKDVYISNFTLFPFVEASPSFKRSTIKFQLSVDGSHVVFGLQDIRLEDETFVHHRLPMVPVINRQYMFHYRTKFMRRRARFYANSCASFNPTKILLVRCMDTGAGFNPGPTTVSTRSTGLSKPKLGCLYLNARSLCNKLIEFHYLVKSEDSSIIAVTETWLHDKVLDSEILDSLTQFTAAKGHLQKEEEVSCCVLSLILCQLVGETWNPKT